VILKISKGSGNWLVEEDSFALRPYVDDVMRAKLTQLSLIHLTY